MSGGPRLALFNPAGLPFSIAGDSSAWPVCTLSRQVTAQAPDLVIAADAALGKRTGHPWLGCLLDDPDRLRRDRRRLDTVLSHDGFLVQNAAQARFLADTMSATGRAAPILALDIGTPDRLAALVAEIRASAGFMPAATGPSVDYIVRIGGRDIRFVRRCLDSLAAQTTPGIGVILVRYGPVAGLEAEIERQRPHFRRLDLIDLPAPTTRSACLWAGLQAVSADLFGMLDDDDALHPNHVTSLAPLALAGSVAIAGSVQVWDDAAGPFPPVDPAFEHRAFHALPPPDRAAFLAWGLAVHSSAFLAPSFLLYQSPLIMTDQGRFRVPSAPCGRIRALGLRRTRAGPPVGSLQPTEGQTFGGLVLPALGPDPGLDFAEDSYLLRRLARAAPFAASWRVTTDFHWRQGGADNTALRPDHRADAMARIADRERLDPVITALRGTAAATDLPPSPAWGQSGDRPDLPRLTNPADFHGLPSNRPLYIYGSGRGGRIVLGELSKHSHLSPTGFLDSHSTGTAFGLPLLQPADLPSGHLQEGLFIIASEHLNAMAVTLRALGAVDIYDAGPHIRLYTALSL